jgi:hypothetical protein
MDWEKDIHATQQPVPTSSVEVLGIMAMNEDEEDEDEEAGKEEVTDFTEVLAKGSPEATMYNEAQTAPMLQDPHSILKASKKKLMLEVVTGSTTEGINPFFAPGSSRNKEGIPAEAFKNMVYLKPMITVPPKPKYFLGTALKWALLQFTEWFEQSREDLGKTVTLVLLSYVRSSLSEPEAIQDVKKHLKGTANNIKKHIFNFHPKNQASSKGKDYQLYTKIRVGTNVFGEDLQQMIDDLKGISSKVSVFKSVLQCANTQLINWISTSHKNLDLTWLTAWVAQKCVTLKAGTCRNTINIDKNMFLDHDVLQVSFQWHLIYDGHTKMDREKAGVEPLYAVHIVAEKKDRTLVQSMMTALLESPGFLRQTSMEYQLAPIFSSDNGPAERAKFLETLEKHKYVQERLLSSVLPELESLDLHAKMSVKQRAISMDDSATAVEEKKNPTARQLLMKIPKKDMPGVSLFVDIGSNWQKSEFLATYPKRWKDEASFVTANIPAYLYHHFGDVGLSFFCHMYAMQLNRKVGMRRRIAPSQPEKRHWIRF